MDGKSDNRVLLVEDSTIYQRLIAGHLREWGFEVVVLADGPDLAPEAIDRVIEAWRGGSEPVVAATYGGIRLHPVLVAREVWEEIPDEGAKTLDAVLVACDDLGPPGDVDFADEVPERLNPWS